MADEISVRARPGRPRSEAVRLAILDATADLMLEYGFSATTIEAIAARARVSKVTIYKWWSSRGAVAIDAYFHRFRETSVFLDSGDVVTDITAQILSVIETFRGRAGQVMAELLGHAQSDPALAEMLRVRWLQPRREAASVVLQRGIDRGEIRSDVSLPVLMARHEPLSDAFAHELVTNTLRGVRPDS